MSWRGASLVIPCFPTLKNWVGSLNHQGLTWNLALFRGPILSMVTVGAYGGPRLRISKHFVLNDDRMYRMNFPNRSFFSKSPGGGDMRSPGSPNTIICRLVCKFHHFLSRLFFIIQKEPSFSKCWFGFHGFHNLKIKFRRGIVEMFVHHRIKYHISGQHS